MAIVEGQKVKIKWSGSNRKQLESHGYVYTKQYDEIEVSVYHLSEKSHAKIKIVCDCCGSEKTKRRTDIDLDGNHFCNNKCYGKWLSESETGKEIANKRKTSIETHCKLCSVKILKIPSEFKGHGNHYCSRSCQGKDRMPKINPNPKKDKACVNCDYCSSPFKVHESRKKNNKWIFCSRECYAKFRSKNIFGDKVHNYQPIVVTCDSCFNEFKTSKWHIENKKNQFCSPECYYEYRSKNYSGENHNQYGTKKSPEQIEKMRITTANMIATGVFPQTNTSIQIKINKVLQKLNFKFEEEIQFKYYVLDFYDKENNLAIEIMGDYWHANPNKYNDYNTLHDIQKKDIKRDKSKRTYLKKYQDLNVLYLWESDITNNLETCVKLIELYVKSNGILDNYHSFNFILRDGSIQLNKNNLKAFFEKANTPLQSEPVV
ncbi:hypothetical protein [Bacillus infantis]|uniref:hypothetical protein n=1 Tax=Bacillus infantis TaxID=324767 RepID=UPI003CFBBF1D